MFLSMFLLLILRLEEICIPYTTTTVAIETIVVDLVPSVVYGSYFQVSFPQIQHKFYKHVNR